MTKIKIKRILVVDDDRDIRHVVAESLLMEGYVVDMAANGQEALEVASSARPDAIVLDLMMPVMDGWAFVARCRKLPWCHDVPIVVVSAAHALRAAADRLRHLGIAALVAKPFDLERLIGIVQACAPLASPENA